MLTLQHRIRKTVAVGMVAGAAGLGASCGISTQQELEIGQQYSAQINRELPIVNDAAVSRYVNQLGNRLAQAGGRSIPYTFYIVNSDQVNAFAIPGGYIYVNRGLIEATDNVAELAGVLAHEIGHVEHRHSVEQMERMQGANLGLTLAYVLLGRQPSGAEQAAIQVGGGLYFASHSREAENEADATAVDLLVSSGIDPRGLTTFFRELLEQRQRSPSQLEQWFSTHPTTEDRIQNVERMIAQIPASRRRGLAMNTDGFAGFKSNLRRYPAAPPSSR